MESLRTSFRGYDRGEVERALADLENRLATSRQSAENLTATIESLREERGMLDSKNRELRRRIKAVSDNPSYATLGAQFEEALRLGEGQAEQLTTEAKAEVDLLQQSTQAKASRMIRDAELHAQKLISDTQARVDEMRLTSEGVAADLTARANVKQAEAFEILSMARREVATALAESERRFAEVRSAQQRAMEVDRAALREYAEQTARNKAVAEEILRAREEESERENMQRHQDAVEQANRLLTEANQRAANASRRAGDAAAEAELALATAQTKASEMVADARALASGIIERAYGRTRELGDQTREHIDALLTGAVTRADRLRHERESLERYVQDVTDLRSPEMIVAEFEERMHLESDTALRRGRSKGKDEVDES